MKERPRFFWMIIFFSAIAAIWCGLTRGSANIPLAELFLPEYRAILMQRALRVLVAAIVGCGLSVSGIALQALLRNPLAEPYLLGTSSGAGLAAAIALTCGASTLSLPFAAFVGALAAIVAVYLLAEERGELEAERLILSGVIVSVALSAVMVWFISSSSNEAIHGLLWWLWGSMEVYDLALVALVGTIVALGLGVIFFFSQDLDAISVGDEDAAHLGIDVKNVKKVLFVTTSLVTASVVALAGIVGFVGLIVPHIMRLVVGPKHRGLIASTSVAAGIFMIACDVAGRTITTPVEIPIGVITALFGAPVFIILMRGRKGIRP